MAFVAGQVALDRDFQLVGGDDLGQQTRTAMENSGIALDELGAGLAIPELLIEIELVVSLP
jgi:enamine deaminase RidA (YjgF/YER057c/UK114 family)